MEVKWVWWSVDVDVGETNANCVCRNFAFFALLLVLLPLKIIVIFIACLAFHSFVCLSWFFISCSCILLSDRDRWIGLQCLTFLETFADVIWLIDYTSRFTVFHIVNIRLFTLLIGLLLFKRVQLNRILVWTDSYSKQKMIGFKIQLSTQRCDLSRPRVLHAKCFCSKSTSYWQIKHISLHTVVKTHSGIIHSFTPWNTFKSASQQRLKHNSTKCQNTTHSYSLSEWKNLFKRQR